MGSGRPRAAPAAVALWAVGPGSARGAPYGAGRCPLFCAQLRRRGLSTAPPPPSSPHPHSFSVSARGRQLGGVGGAAGRGGEGRGSPLSDKGPRWGRPRSPPSPPLLSPARSDRGAPHGPIAEPRSPPGVPDVTAWGGHPGLEEGGEGGWGGLWVLVGPSLHRSPPQRVICRPRGRADLSALPQPPQLREAAGPGGGGRQQTDAGAHRGGRPDGECPHIPPPYPPPCAYPCQTPRAVHAGSPQCCHPAVLSHGCVLRAV